MIYRPSYPETHDPASTTCSRVSNAIATVPHLRAALAALRAVNAPDAWVGAGCLRNAVWDIAHGRAPELPDDIDVAFFDPDDDGFAEPRLEAELRARAPALPWQARNQARMHRRHGHPPYQNTAAVAHWVETATAVIARETAPERYEIRAPHGLQDLEALILRPIADDPRTRAAFAARLAAKGWPRRWPELRVASAAPAGGPSQTG